MWILYSRISDFADDRDEYRNLKSSDGQRVTRTANVLDRVADDRSWRSRCDLDHF